MKSGESDGILLSALQSVEAASDVLHDIKDLFGMTAGEDGKCDVRAGLQAVRRDLDVYFDGYHKEKENVLMWKADHQNVSTGFRSALEACQGAVNFLQFLKKSVQEPESYTPPTEAQIKEVINVLVNRMDSLQAQAVKFEMMETVIYGSWKNHTKGCPYPYGCSCVSPFPLKGQPSQKDLRKAYESAAGWNHGGVAQVRTLTPEQTQALLEERIREDIAGTAADLKTIPEDITPSQDVQLLTEDEIESAFGPGARLPIPPPLPTSAQCHGSGRHALLVDYDTVPISGTCPNCESVIACTESWREGGYPRLVEHDVSP